MTEPRPSLNDAPAVSPTVYSWPSPCPVWAHCPSTWTPSNSSLSLKLTTPAIASEPYAADAPPVTTSTPEISAGDNTFRSGEPRPSAGIRRRPSSKTSVCATPMPRNDTFAWPSFAGSFEVPVADGANWGSVLRMRSTETAALCSNASAVSVTMGLGASKSGLAMREPVTRTSSSSPSLASAASLQSASITAPAEAARTMGLTPCVATEILTLGTRTLALRLDERAS